MSAFNIWRDDPPPRGVWIWVKYSLTKGEWQLVKSCRNGCCVISSFGCMVLPPYWRSATQQEGDAEQAKWENIKPIDLSTLY